MEEKKPKLNKIKMKAKKTRNELKVSDLETYPLKNEGKSSRICLRKPLGSVTEAPRLRFSSRKQFFSPKIAEMHSQGN